MVADDLSRKSIGSLAYIVDVRRSIMKEFQELVDKGVEFEVTGTESLLAQVQVCSTLVESIKGNQDKDPHLRKIMEKVQADKVSNFVIDYEGVLCLGKRLCSPNMANLKKKIFEEAHHSSYTIRRSFMKMYQDLKEFYWWEGIKKEVAKFVSKCLVCQQVKAEHQKPARTFASID